MRLLLDTHIWVWFIAGAGALRKRTDGILKDSSNELWLSPMSIFELLILHSKGRVSLSENPREWIAQAIRGTREAPITHEIMMVARELDLHRDPADRILAATAQVLELTLVTADAQLLGLGTIRTLNNH